MPPTFSEVEALLRSPAADGEFVYYLKPESPLAEAGLRIGDIITAVVRGEETTPIAPKATADLNTFLGAMQPQDDGDTARTLRITRGEAETLRIEVPPTIEGLKVCAVTRGEPAWQRRDDYEGPPDFSALRDGAEITLRNAFDDAPAGFEWTRMRRRGDLLEVDIVFRLGSDGEPDERWEYFTRARSTHRLDKHLSVVRSSFYEGKGADEVRTGSVRLGDDGIWRGVRRGKDGADEDVTLPMETPHLLTTYAAKLLPLTMPLAEGACLTWQHAYDGDAKITCRSRMECRGRRTVKVDGQDLEAWCFGWRLYGDLPLEEDALFYVTDDRRMVRVDWGPGYGYCWAELLDADRWLEGVPENVKADLPGFDID